MNRRPRIAVIGGASADVQMLEHALQTGRLIAQAGALLLCGGRCGVMEAASKGACETGGEVIGILPGPDERGANPYVTIPLPTGLGHARNAVIAQAAEALIAIGGEYGTLSEIALALKSGRPVVALGSWPMVPGLLQAGSPEEAVRLALQCISRGS